MEEEMTRKTRDEELKAVANTLEMLALEVQAMTGSTKSEAVPVQTQIMGEFRSGRRVRIVLTLVHENEDPSGNPASSSRQCAAAMVWEKGPPLVSKMWSQETRGDIWGLLGGDAASFSSRWTSRSNSCKSPSRKEVGKEATGYRKSKRQHI
jgi:hypothetical protein